MREVVAVINRRVIVIVNILRQYVLAFFRYDLEKHLAPEGDIAELVPLLVYMLLVRAALPQVANTVTK